jgi:uncharacterized Zn-binding protein involved in type VI secretion
MLTHVPSHHDARAITRRWPSLVAAGAIVVGVVAVGATAHDGSASLSGTRTEVAATPTARSGDVHSMHAVDASAIAARWGVRVEGIRLAAAGYMLDFRYRVVDARKAKPLFDRRTKPVLLDEATGARMTVPTPPTTGALRNSNDPKAGRTYFMFFANPARFVQSGNTVTITIGAFSVDGLRVE